MRFRTYKNTDLRVTRSVRSLDDLDRLVGPVHEGEAIALMHKAFDLGITLMTRRYLWQWA